MPVTTRKRTGLSGAWQAWRARRRLHARTRKSRRGTEDPPFVKWLLIGVSLAFVLTFLLLPLVNVFAQALAKGWQGYF